jgi:hypothetical protein
MTRSLHALTLPIVASLMLVAAMAAAAAEHRSPETDAEIDYLLARVADSGYVFIRNGDEHDGPEAASHMRRKFEHFDDEIETAEEFIEKSATRSLLTRRAYEVRFADGTQTETADWLLGELATYRAERDEAAVATPPGR